MGGLFRTLTLTAATLISAAVLLGGCSNGNDGSTGIVLGTNVSVSSNVSPATPAAAAAWAKLEPQVTVTSVTIASQPVVKFTVKDSNGRPVVGLGNKSQSATATVAGLTNVAFTLAKLVPATASTPSKWVSYNVLRPPTVAEKTAAPTISWYGTYPTTDTQGTLVDNGDGSYQYTFYRDPQLVAAIVAALTDDAAAWKYKADLGDTTYDATLTHRLGIQIGGNAPGTGSNTPTAVTNPAYPAVPMVNAGNIVYDFRPDGAAVTNTRDIVKIDSCSSCHAGKVLAHGSRKDPRYCVTCHTEQIKYSFNMEAPSTNGGLTLTGGTTGTTAKKRAETAVVDARAIGNFPNFIHKLHYGKNLVKTGYNYNANGGAMMFNKVNYPQSVLYCTKCHDGSTTANGDNYLNVPSRLACGSCHDGINFATGGGVTLADKAKDIAAKVPVGTTQSGHAGGARSDDSSCVGCHGSAAVASYHSTASKLPASDDAAKRTMSAAITGVTVDAVTGKVTAKFTVTDGGVAVTDKTKFTAPTFILAKLVMDSQGVLNWVGYTNQMNTKNEAIGLIAQTKGETGGTLVANADGSFSYTFALTGSTAGDIRTVAHAHNVAVSTKGTPGKYATDNGDPAYAKTVEIPNPVSYEPTKTHRVAMTFSKTYAAGTTPTTGAAGLDAWFDFIPAGGTVWETRDIVKMGNCANCHANRKLHAAYRVEVCVTCHNPSTKDPFTGETVALENIVHKLHMGTDLPTSIKPYMINGEDFSIGAFPGVIKKCQTCHVETGNANGANWRMNPTSGACITCHDDVPQRAHAAERARDCTTCHSTGMEDDTAVVSNK